MLTTAFIALFITSIVTVAWLSFQDKVRYGERGLDVAQNATFTLIIMLTVGGSALLLGQVFWFMLW